MAPYRADSVSPMRTPRALHGLTLSNPLWFWGGVLLVVGLLYGQTSGFGFLWDDDQILYGRPDYRNPSDWWEAIRKPLDFSPNYFRPLALTSLLVQIWLWGDNPAPFHLANVGLHLLNTLLVMAIGWQWLRHGGFSALAGLLYGLHPALVESVAFVSSRYDLLMTTFLLLGFWWTLRLSGWVRQVGVGLALLCALLCKEMAVMAIGAFPLALWAMRPRQDAVVKDSRPIRTTAPLAGMAGAILCYLAVRWFTLGYLLTAPPAGLQIEAGSGLQHLLLVGRTVATLLGLAIFPFFSISPIHHSPLPVPLQDGTAWLQLGIAGALLVGFALLMRRKPTLGGLLGAGVILLVPVLNLRPLEFAFGIFTAERFLTAPLAFFVLGGIAWGFEIWALRSERAFHLWSGAVGAWVIGAFVVTALTLPNWRDSRVFWEWATRAAPQSPIGFSNLSDYWNKQGDYQRALQYAERAIQIAPQSGMGWVNKGVALLRLGDAEKAIEMFRKGTQVEPENVIGWNNLAVMLAERGQLDEAERIIRAHLLGKVPYMLGYQAMGLVQMRKGRPDLAEPYVQDALRYSFQPQGSLAEQLAEQLRNAEIWLASAYRAILNGDMHLAQKLLERGRSLDPNKISLAYVEGMILLKQGQIAEAEAKAHALLDYGYEDARLYELLALCAQQRGDTATARTLLEKARQRGAPQ